MALAQGYAMAGHRLALALDNEMPILRLPTTENDAKVYIAI